MTVKLFVLLCFLSSFNLHGQTKEEFTIYKWDELSNIPAEKVRAISFKRKKLKDIPIEILQYKNLSYLDLSANKLDSLPPFINKLIHLRNLNLGKNKFKKFPNSLFTLSSLEVLVLNRNEISELPESIVHLQKLNYLDLWDNPIAEFPNAFEQMPKLRELHVEGIKYGPKFQAYWTKVLGQTKIYFDPPCDCKE